MLRIILVSVGLAISQLATAACPDFLNHTMRKLHSPDSVNFCDSYAGKTLLIVNTASHCGFTPQFKGLEELYQTYQAQGLVVLGFASDDFNQEDASEEKAAEICYVNNGVTFTMLAPSHVRGEDANPVFKALAESTVAPNWNFNKYIVSKEGKVVAHYGSSTKPNSPELLQALQSEL